VPSALSASLGLVTACLFASSEARADVTSWLAVGGGYGLERNGVSEFTDRATAMSLSLGVGSSPRAPVVVGGLMRSVTYFSLGTDLSIGPRIATGGFSRGDWGLALDVGAVARWWNDGQYGRYPLQGVLTLGAPWGLQLGVGAQMWNIAGEPYATGGFAVLEMDLLRFTVMRRGSTDSTWFNPSPAGGRDPR
jgi:hypothetical protein